MRKKKKRVGLEKKLLNSPSALMPGSGLSWYKFRKPNYKILKTFDNPSCDESIVTFTTNELTALCPLTGFADFYNLKIEYIPDKKCIESKSAKFYFGSYRDKGGFIENLANNILADWVRASDPIYVKIDITMNVRGGVGINVVKTFKKDGGVK